MSLFVAHFRFTFGQFDQNCMSIYTKWWGPIMILKNFMVQGNKMPSEVMIILFIWWSNIVDPSNQIHSLKEITFTRGSCLFTCTTKRLPMLVGPIFLKSFRNVSHHHPFYIFLLVLFHHIHSTYWKHMCNLFLIKWTHF